ncbi:MAG: sensor histidine kinase [Leptolyngbya sp. BL-A-14]
MSLPTNSSSPNSSSLNQEHLALFAGHETLPESVDASLVQALLENQSLKEQIAQQTQLMQLLTHQLATPLTSLSGSVSLLAEPELQPEQQQEFLVVVQQQVHRLKLLLHDLIALQNLETGALETHKESFCLPSLAQEVIAGFQTAQTVCDFRPDLPFVWGDRWQVSQVLVNLLSNAIKYSPEGTPIELGAAIEPSSWVTVWVRDYGLGIPAADQPYLFERFYRVQHHDRSTIKGTGLGLSLCKLLVENQGGQLHVESTHGEGSCFSFTLPITPSGAMP